MRHTVVVFYYTQSGQALDIARSICQPIEAAGHAVVYKPIVPTMAFPFPWSRKEFFAVFPETRLGLPPCGIQSIDLSDVTTADLVIIAGQTWFLSPSLPLQAFFADKHVQSYLKGRHVIFVNGCRNMWLMTARQIRRYLGDADAHFVGHIVLQDRHSNLVSVATIIRWLIYGRKAASRHLPQAGISDQDIADAQRFGHIISKAFDNSHIAFSTLQDRLLQAGAIEYTPAVLFLEKNGHRIFRFWANFIRRKGKYGDKARDARCTLFFVYLLAALYIVSPFALLFFYLTRPFRNIRRQQAEDCATTARP